MIKVKHIQTARTEKAPDWKEAEEFLKTIREANKNIVSVSAYPTGLHHNMVIIYDDGEMR